MENDNRYSPASGGILNTLVQSGTIKIRKPEIVVNGNGSDIKNIKSMRGKAKRKVVTQKMILSLVDVSKNKKQPERQKSYWNTYHCQNTVFSSAGRLYGKYCKNRFCTVCCANRKADIMNRYLPVIKGWEDPYFVTLTVKSVGANKLSKWIKRGMIRGFRLIVEKYRKRNQRGNGIKLVGIKSLECNFNSERKTYNPHFHIIVPNKEIAEILISEWMSIWNRKGKRNAVRYAQKMSRVRDNEKVLIEIVKYGSKIFTEPDVNKKSKQKRDSKIYTAALDNIFLAMKGCRIFERFGFNLPKENTEEVQPFVLDQYDEWTFDPKLHDWSNVDTGKPLTGYLPPDELLGLLDNYIDTQLE